MAAALRSTLFQITASNTPILRSSSSSLFGPVTISAVPRTSSRRRHKSIIKCEQTGQSLGVWLGRFAMLGFVGTLGVEIATGKGLLETVGLTTPAPTPALAITGVIGVITAFGIFRSASSE